MTMKLQADTSVVEVLCAHCSQISYVRLSAVVVPDQLPLPVEPPLVEHDAAFTELVAMHREAIVRGWKLTAPKAKWFARSRQVAHLA